MKEILVVIAVVIAEVSCSIKMEIGVAIIAVAEY